MAMQLYQQTLQQYHGQVLPSWHPSSMMVQRVLDRLIPSSGVADSAWEVHVIDDPGQKNAFVMPGWVYIDSTRKACLERDPDH